jgi:Spy/CpxP family protein refolding chaperone
MYRLFPVGFLVAALLGAAAHASSPSEYAGQESREIKALSHEDVQAYLAGKGMGLAKAAELNGYPGPSHVLGMATELELTADQIQRTQAIFSHMQRDAISLGRDLIDEERKLDRQFSEKTISAESLSQSLKRIGEIQAQVRQVHLGAHLAQIAILTPAQVSKYESLRGYSNIAQPDTHAGHNH